MYYEKGISFYETHFFSVLFDLCAADRYRRMIKQKKLKQILFVSAALILLNIIMNLCGNILKIEHYSLTSDKLTEPVRIVFISDLHDCTYGGDSESGLFARIQAEQPDLVLFGGDVIDYKGGTSHSLKLMQLVKDAYPCAYTSGNHEVMRKDTEAFYEAVAALGIPVLHGTCMDVSVRQQKIRLCGVIHAIENENQLKTCCQSADSDNYTILLIHQPEQLDDVTAECAADQTSFDLVLSGHAHGGQWRVPGLLEQGLYAPDQGIFPEFTGGQRTSGKTIQIVSRGLAKPLRMFLFPRIFNRPELSVIDINPA